MSTTFYIFKKLDDKQKQEIKNNIDKDNYLSVCAVDIPAFEIALRAGGHKFLIYYSSFFPEDVSLTFESIKKYLLDNEKDFIIQADLGNTYSISEFFQEIENWKSKNQNFSDWKDDFKESPNILNELIIENDVNILKNNKIWKKHYCG